MEQFLAYELLTLNIDYSSFYLKVHLPFSKLKNCNKSLESFLVLACTSCDGVARITTLM